MRWFAAVAVGFLLGACGGGDGESGATGPTGPDGACGDVTEWTVTVRGAVEQGGVPVEGADVRLDERLWTIPNKTFGTAVSGADGTFEFVAPDVISVEDCWGSALDYVLVAVRGDKSGEMDMNSSLFSAINDGDLEADVSSFPIELN